MSDLNVTIRSSRDGTELTLATGENSSSEGLEISIVGPECSARLSTSTYYSGSPAQLFKKMADSWRGWEDELSWSTLEGEFRLSATTDRLGHVDLMVEMHSDVYPRVWELKARLALEAGSLGDLYRKVVAVFPIHPNAPRD